MAIFPTIKDAKRVLNTCGNVSALFAALHFDSVYVKKFYTTA